MSNGRRPDDTAVAALFRQHRSALRRYLIGRVGPSHADDVLSETFLAAHRRWSSFDPARGPAIGWLFGIATTAVRSHARDERRHFRRMLAAAGAGMTDTAGTAGADDAVDRVDALGQVRRLLPDLLALGDVDRDLLLLVAWGGLTPGEAAASLGLVPATARSRLHRARLRLRRADGAPSETLTSVTTDKGVDR